MTIVPILAAERRSSVSSGALVVVILTLRALDAPSP
jgi:hypothetical protein